MAAVLLFWDSNMAAVTSCENILFYVQVWILTKQEVKIAAFNWQNQIIDII